VTRRLLPQLKKTANSCGDEGSYEAAPMKAKLSGKKQIKKVVGAVVDSIASKLGKKGSAKSASVSEQDETRPPSPGSAPKAPPPLPSRSKKPSLNQSRRTLSVSGARTKSDAPTKLRFGNT